MGITIDLPLPPKNLIFIDADADAMLRKGRELLGPVADSGYLAKARSILDIGCGYGRLTYALVSAGYAGTYVGVDILPRHIRWLRVNLAPLLPGFDFRHLDVMNGRYNPAGTLRPDEVRLWEGPGKADLVLLFSVFTHMHAGDIEHYLTEIAAALAPDGACFATFFLLNGESEDLIAVGRSQYPMAHRLSDTVRTHSLDDPLHAIAYDETWVRAAIARAGLRVETMLPGKWCGRTGGITGQDTLIIRTA